MMSIHLRCKSCHTYYAPAMRACPRCDTKPPPSPRQYYFRKQWNGTPYNARTGYLSLREAEAEHAEWLHRITSSPASAVRSLRWKEVSDAYLDKLDAEGKAYGKKARLFLDRMVAFWGDIHAHKLTPEMIKRFQVHLRGIGASPAYCDRHLAIGKAAWNYSLESVTNPFSKVKFYHPDNTLIRFLTDEEEAALLEAAEHVWDKRRRRGPRHAHELVLLAVRTGMRVENILNLHTDETDFENREITVRQKRDLTHTVPMTEEIWAAFSAIRPWNGGHYFVSHRTGRPYTKIDGTFALIKKDAGITRAFRFHDLRHHYATKLARLTGNLRVVQEALGHRCIQTTMRYSHVLQDDIRTAMESLARTQTAVQKQYKVTKKGRKTKGYLRFVR